jgi:hypothetical protein
VIKNNLNNWLLYFSGEEEIELSVNSGEKLKNLKISRDKKGNTFFFAPKLLKLAQGDSKAFEVWKRG